MKIGRLHVLAYRVTLPYIDGDPFLSLTAHKTDKGGVKGARLSAIAGTEGIEIVLLLAPKQEAKHNVQETDGTGGCRPA